MARRVPTRPAGILVTGKRAIYDNTLFGYEGHPIAGWIRGRLRCEYIDQLANDYDDLVESEETPPETNPLPIISRRRRGLANDHPFWDALNKAVNEVVGPVIAALEEAGQTGTEPKESPGTRRRLDNLGTSGRQNAPPRVLARPQWRHTAPGTPSRRPRTPSGLPQTDQHRRRVD